MLGRSVGVFTTCALGAGALLIPPGLEPTAPGDNAPFDIVRIIDPTNRVIELPCPSCAFSNTNEEVEDVEGVDDLVFIQGGAKNLILNFTVTEDGRALKMNNREIYPSWSPPGKLGHGWSVDQVSASASLDEVEAGEVKTVPLGITGSSSGAHKQVTDAGDTLVSINVKIHSLEHQAMDLSAVDILLMEFHEDDEVRLHLIDAMPRNAGPMDDPDLMPPPQAHGPPHGRPHGPPSDMKDCGMLPTPVCRLKHMMEDKFSGLRHGGSRRPGCSGRKGGKGGPHRLPGHIKGPKFPMADNVDPAHRGGGHGPPPHMGGWKHHGHKHSFLHHFVKGFIAVMIPIMAGVAVGMTVSLLGMLAGRFIGVIWTRITGARRQEYVSLTQEELEEGSEDGPAEMEAPPAYEHAPAYYMVAEKE
ncbi:hypothetical protein K431DRAFT_281198 [Polychaeton citri CBS 116435]|uniref:Uncharacterized protein n=1 Tax=Polychaeton citri CBS 116435 TaxID=1314669 RepID=A0A9P4USP4_9PEZI|nr:hypothetical protein K431DRAFT_281198 [Polychaeton citri CBS 116435]